MTRPATITRVQPEDRVLARVVDVRDNGIFVTYKGRSGLVNVTELSWDERRPANPFAYANIGQELEVAVTAVGETSFGASLKRLEPGGDPWRKIHVGMHIRGRTRDPLAWGQFAELTLGLVALILGETLPASREFGFEVATVDRNRRHVHVRLRPPYVSVADPPLPGVPNF